MYSFRVLAGTVCSALLAPGLYAQSVGLSARDLYYEKETPGPANKVAPAAHRLGLRYSLLKIDPATRAVQAVDPDGNFKAGDCFALEFSPNRAGKLYIFNQGSSGEWQLMMPSPSMPDELTSVKAGGKVRVPQEFCFQLDGPRGVETLVVAVTEDPREIDTFRTALNVPISGAGTTATRTASAKLVADRIKDWREQQLKGRDIYLEKTEPDEVKTSKEVKTVKVDDERPYSVYVVQKPSEGASHLVAEIKIRHE